MNSRAMKLVLSVLLCGLFISGFAQGGFLGKKRGIDIDVAELALFHNIRPTAQIALTRYFSLSGSVLYGWHNTTDVLDYSRVDATIKFDQQETRFAWRIGAQLSSQLSDNYAPLGFLYKIEFERFNNQRLAKPLSVIKNSDPDEPSVSEYLFVNKGFIISCFWGISKNIGSNFYYSCGFDFGVKVGTLYAPDETGVSSFHFNKSDSFWSELFAVWPNESSAGFYTRFYVMPRARFGFLF